MAKEKKEKNQKNDKRSFMKDFKAELKKVVWPTSKQMVNNVVAVITIVFVTAAIVYVLDFAFQALNTYGIDKIKKSVQDKSQTVQIEEPVVEENNEVTPEQSVENPDAEAVPTENQEQVDATEATPVENVEPAN